MVTLDSTTLNPFYTIILTNPNLIMHEFKNKVDLQNWNISNKINTINVKLKL